MDWRRYLWFLSLLPSLVAFPLAIGGARSAEKVLHAPGPLGNLEGTYLSTADAISPIVIIIPGSGPTDRDGNNAHGVTASTYKLLAQGLAKRGIGSIRIDKRGMFGSSAAIQDPNNVTLADYADDIHSWIMEARRVTGVQCVWLLGHSEGGLVALVSAQRKGPICGLILVASPGRPLGDILRQQLRDNPANAPILPDAMDAISALELGRRVDVADFHPALQQLFAPELQGFLMDLISYDPSMLISNITIPSLILQGASDLQVTVYDARKLHDALPEARLIVLPGTNHVLKLVKTKDRQANLATYTNANLPLAPGIIEAVKAFIDGSTPNR